MGRAKIALKFINNQKLRNKTYQKRKKSLIKKAQELSILCNVPICTIFYPFKEGDQQFSQPEVYFFKKGVQTLNQNSDHQNNSGDPNMVQETDHKMVREMLARYVACSKEEKHKRALSLYDMFDEMKRKAQQELFKLRQKNAKAKYTTWDSTILELSIDQLMGLFVSLNNKIELVGQKIAMINNMKGVNNQGANLDYSLINQLPPISSFMPMVPRCINNAYLDYHEIKAMNQLEPLDPSYSGPTTSKFEEMKAMHMDMVVDHYGGNNKLVYNMNLMGPIYIDQGPRFADYGPVASSYGHGVVLPFSRPLHLPMLSKIPPTRFYKPE